VCHWSFRETGTMGTLASQTEIGVMGPSTGGASPGGSPRVLSPEKKFEIVYAKPCNLENSGPENGSQCRSYNFSFLNTSTMGTPFPLVSRRNAPDARCSGGNARVVDVDVMADQSIV